MAVPGAGGSRSYNFKIVLLGEGCVGKTSLVLRYVEDKFNDRHITTLQASFLTKRVNISGKRVNLAIWDTAGQERFHALGPIYYRESHGAILVYDITDEDSFQKVKNWVRELRRMLGNDICLVIAGNKLDLQKDRHVLLEEAEGYAQEVGAFHVQTSAKENNIPPRNTPNREESISINVHISKSVPQKQIPSITFVGRGIQMAP
ncbi:ras-related protein Rab-21-like [Macrobrachium nipponense]|uniref:ras-related protein Rab-21-like n=1 Tax=Macrobrachium nipponense TaxID=159736 RepID=UPI0030C82F13